jgi:hypothetical protein
MLIPAVIFFGNATVAKATTKQATVDGIDQKLLHPSSSWLNIPTRLRITGRAKYANTAMTATPVATTLSWREVREVGADI